MLNDSVLKSEDLLSERPSFHSRPDTIFSVPSTSVESEVTQTCSNYFNILYVRLYLTN
jgi:hypothetical protein